jgi:SAM-dependent methyltransferase
MSIVATSASRGSQRSVRGAARTSGRTGDPADDLARYYDLDMLDVDEDVGMYLALAREQGGPILELAAGSGRIAVPLARAGHRVVAVDHDPAMLARAQGRWDATPGVDRERGGALSIVEADLTLYRSDERFGLAILALNSLMLIPDADARSAALLTMRAHLREGGLAVVDVVTPDVDELGSYDGRVQLDWVREDAERGELVTKLISAIIHPEEDRVELTQLFDVTPTRGGTLRRIVRRDTLHLVSATALRSLAAGAGLDDLDVRGDHRLTAHGPGSPRAILMGRLV